MVTYGAGRLKVSLDGTQVLDTAVTLPSQIRLGFTGGTGGFSDNHTVRNVVVTRF